MLFDKPRIAPSAYTRKISLRKRLWYLFPHRWRWKKSVAEITYKADVDAYIHRHFWIIERIQFSWLFIDIVWELRQEHLSSSMVRHESLRYFHDLLP